MQLLNDNLHSDHRPTFMKTESHNTVTDETDETMDSSSEHSSAACAITDASVISENWSDLNETDLLSDLSSPPLSELIDRGVIILERYIVNVMAWRGEKVAHLLTATETAHGGRVSPDATSDGVRIHTIALNPLQKSELIQYVSTIAGMYKDVLYHNFEHASHVLASSDSLIAMLKRNSNRINRGSMSTISSSSKMSMLEDSYEGSDDYKIHLSTFGISSCPMTHLALVFSALVHDVEHQGVGNNQLVTEEDPLAVKYNGKSVAENNSHDISLEILNESRYSNLRQSIFGYQDVESSDARKEMEHDEKLFHKVMLDVIHATDISSTDRLEGNKEKWRKAFQDANANFDSRSNCHCQFSVAKTSRRSSVPPDGVTNIGNIYRRRMSMTCPSKILKQCPACSVYLDECMVHMDYLRASSVLEQMIQASDVAHVMQSWPIFMKWNTKLYDELWAANLSGRGPDVSAGWFKGQIGFFDHYIEPLAKRLEQCGVFGPLGALFLENVHDNRMRWLEEGEERCREMHERVLNWQGDKSQG